MTDIRDMQNIASELYESNDSRKWLFAHTATQDEYVQVRRALKVLAGFKPVNWEGKTGNRRPVPCRSNQLEDKYDIAYDILMENGAGFGVI